MKTKIATAISLVGVLAAGSAAAMVNTQLLDDESAAAGTSAAVLAPDPAPEVGQPGEPQVIVIPASEAASSTSDSVGAVAAASSTGGSTAALTEFTVGSAGTVSVDVVDGQPVVVDAQPNTGWTLVKSEARAGQVEVYFATETVRVEFTARLVDGEIIPDVDSTSIGASPSGPTPSPTGEYDDSDEYEDSDEHEDSHEPDDHDEYEDSDEPDDHDDEFDDHEEDEPDDD